MSKPTDQERFNAAVMHWISEASTFLYHYVAKNEGGKQIIADACQQCWNAYGRDTTMVPEPKNVPTLSSRLSSAEICRANGWVAGDILCSRAGSVEDPARVRITAVGDYTLLVRECTGKTEGIEQIFYLNLSDWNREPVEPKKEQE